MELDNLGSDPGPESHSSVEQLEQVFWPFWASVPSFAGQGYEFLSTGLFVRIKLPDKGEIIES